MAKIGLVILLLTAVSALHPVQVSAQSGRGYPAKPIKIVVVQTPGGNNDIIARLFASTMSEELKQPVLIENRPGGAGITGVEYVVRSAPDGYTLLMGNTASLAIQKGLYANLPYDPDRDLVAVSLLAVTPNILVVHPSVAVRNAAELVVLAKARPDSLNYASTGNGSPTHLAAELFKSRTGAKMVHVPYKGSAPALADLLAGHIQLMFINVGEAVAHINSGKLTPIVTTGQTRHPLAPNVPTLVESGIPNAELVAFFAITVPAGTPREIIAILNNAIEKPERQPEISRRLVELGAQRVGNSPEEAEKFIRTESAKWLSAVRDSGAKVDN